MRARMRRPRRKVSRCSAEYAAADPLEDVVTLFEGLFLSAPFIPLLRVGLGGIAHCPLRLCRRTADVHGPVCGPGRAGAIPQRGPHACSGTGGLLVLQTPAGRDPARGRRDVRGLYMGLDRSASLQSGPLQSWNGNAVPRYRTKTANASRQGLVAKQPTNLLYGQRHVCWPGIRIACRRR